MQDLRLIGVHEDGMHVILGDDEGNRYRVELDEPLRAAARRDRPRLGQLQIQIEGGLRPKDVQTMIRAGLTADEVAERAGWTVDKVHRYEGPILAEREHVAGLAQQVRLRPRGASHGTGPTLGARVTERLGSREIDAAGSRWDSRRVNRGAWTVLLYFNAGGRERQAAWDFDLVTRAVTATDDEARWLSEDDTEATAGPIPAPHLQPAGRPSRVYDVEAEGGVGAPARRKSPETVDLMAAMRERSSHRGRRRRTKPSEVPGIAQAPEDALLLEPLAVPPAEMGPPPAAHTHPLDDQGATSEPAAEQDRDAQPTVGQANDLPDDLTNDLTNDLANDSMAETGADGPTDSATGEATAAVGGSVGGATSAPIPQAPPEASADQAAEPPAEAAAEPPAEAAVEPPVTAPAGPAPTATTASGPKPEPPDGKGDVEDESLAAPRPGVPKAGARRSGRPSVPSWDDIMFGRKGD